MSDMIRCSNCLRELSAENRFCIFCGFPLSSAARASGTAGAVPAPSAVPCYGPNGHDVPDPSLGFCPVCGSLLTSEPGGSEEPPVPDEPPVPEIPPVPAFPEAPASPAPVLIRKCSCGYECDDPELNFCPACGIPLEKAEPAPVAVEGDWICAECGAMNRLDMNFCTTCGRPKSKRTAPEPAPGLSGVAPRRGDRTVIPEGMYMPTDDDLAVKAKYGN